MAAFTAIAAGVGAAASLAGIGMSFGQMGEAQSLQRNAANAAAKSMADAKKALEINYYSKLGIKKEPYELEREALLASGAQAIQAGVESERGAAATAGRVQLAMNEGQAGIRTAMGREMTDIEARQLAEQSRLRDVGVQLDLETVAGAQQAMAVGAQKEAQAQSNIAAGFGQLASQATALVPLFEKSASAKALGNLVNQAQGNKYSQEEIQNAIAKQGGSFAGLGYHSTGLDAQGKPIAGVATQAQFTDRMSGMSKQQIKSLSNLFSVPNTGQYKSAIIPTGQPTQSAIYGKPINEVNLDEFYGSTPGVMGYQN